jgi:hypothetical protein
MEASLAGGYRFNKMATVAAYLDAVLSAGKE